MQSRMLGATVGIAAATSILNSIIRVRLGSFLSQGQINKLLQDIATLSDLPPIIQGQVETNFSDAYKVHMVVLTVVSGFQLLAVSLMWRRPQLSFH